MLGALGSASLARAPTLGSVRRLATMLLLPGVAALAALGVPAPAAAQQPAYEPERALVEAVARYQALAAGPDLRPPASRTVVRRGDVYPAAATLRRHLAALGDLPAVDASSATVGADTVYDDRLVSGVVAFQRRHGLEPDGVIGPVTMAQLRVPMARRARQLELALERWRQLPDTVGERTIVVNVPAFRLYAFERDAATGRPHLRMNVIVGQAEGRHATPRFSGVMREVVFQPYWDVPIGIARRELLPRIRRDPAYLDREAMEIVRGGDHDAVIMPPTPANLDRVATGALRLRQRPGPLNALGPVKFLFPNRYNVYLHGTPAQSLFAPARRDFSHGCIRVEDPASLAIWVLEGQAGWDSASVTAAMTTGAQSRRVRLERAVQVHVLYATAVVGDDGLVRFYPDIYGHDAATADTPATEISATFRQSLTPKLNEPDIEVAPR